MESKAIKKPSQKNINKMMPNMSPKWFQMGSPNGAKIVKNDVLEAPCFKGGSQMASRAPPILILTSFWLPNGLQSSIQGRFGKGFRTIFAPCLIICSDIFVMIFAYFLYQHVANKNVPNHRESKELPRNSFSLRAIFHCKLHYRTLMSFWVLGKGLRQFLNHFRSLGRRGLPHTTTYDQN